MFAEIAVFFIILNFFFKGAMAGFPAEHESLIFTRTDSRSFKQNPTSGSFGTFFYSTRKISA